MTKLVLFAECLQVFLFKIVFQTIQGRLEIVSDLSFFSNAFFMGLILMKKLSLLFDFILGEFFIFAEDLFRSRNMLFRFYLVLLYLFFNCFGLSLFLLLFFDLLLFLFLLLSSCLLLFFLLAFNLFFFNLLLFFLLFLLLFHLYLDFYLFINILNFLFHGGHINSDIKINIFNFCNMDGTHHKIYY